MSSKERTASPARKGSLAAQQSNNNKTGSPVLTRLAARLQQKAPVQQQTVIARPASEFCPSTVNVNTNDNLNSPGAPDTKTTLKIHLVDGGFNVVKCSDSTDIKVRKCTRTRACMVRIAFLSFDALALFHGNILPLPVVLAFQKDTDCIYR